MAEGSQDNKLSVPWVVLFSPSTDWVVGGDMKHDSAKILFQFFFLQEAIVNSSGMGWDVHFLMLSIQHFLCRPQHILKDGFAEAVVVCDMPQLPQAALNKMTKELIPRIRVANNARELILDAALSFIHCRLTKACFTCTSCTTKIIACVHVKHPTFTFQ